MLTFIVAMQKEADALLRFADGADARMLCGKTVYTGRAFGSAFRLILSGVGKTNAAAAAMLAVSAFGAERLVNFGMAGGVSEAAAPGAVLRADRAVQYDFDLSEINGTPRGTLDEYGQPYFFLPFAKSAFPRATLATGDKLTDSLADLPVLLNLRADLRDMEGAAIAHVASFTGVPLSVYKAVSNRIGADSVKKYNRLQSEALNALSKNMQTIFGENDGEDPFLSKEP